MWLKCINIGLFHCHKKTVFPLWCSLLWYSYLCRVKILLLEYSFCRWWVLSRGRGVPADDAAWQAGGGGEILRGSRKLLLGASRRRSRTTTTTSTSAGVQQHVDPDEPAQRLSRHQSRCGGSCGEQRPRGLFQFLHAEDEGAEWLRDALLAGLPVPKRAHWGAAHQGGIPETKAGGLHQPVQERHAWALRLRQRHRVLQQRRGMAGVWWVDKSCRSGVRLC